MYSITENISENLVELKFCGHMAQDPEAFFNDLAASVRTVKHVSNPWSMLIDFSETSVMNQDRARNTAKIFEWCLENGISKAVFVANSVTQRMQIKRVTGNNERVGVFETEAEARKWLHG